MTSSFPEPIHYSRENSPGWKIKDWDTADKLLSYLNTDGMSFACFQKPDKSYFQCAGSKCRLTAEARLYNAPEQYRHYVFGKGALTDKKEIILTTDNEVIVDSSQVLQMRHVRLILRPWLEGGSFPANFTMTDVTERFSGQENRKMKQAEQGAAPNGYPWVSLDVRPLRAALITLLSYK